MTSLVTTSCNEKDHSLSPKSLKKLRLFSAMALVGFPLFSIVGMWDWLDDFSKPVQFFVSLFLLMSFLPLVSNRIYNRLSRNKGRLDEREREAIRQAEAFSYRAIIILLLAAITLGLGLSGVSGVEIKTPYISIGLAAITLMNILFVMLFLPITYIAWTQKPLADEF